MKTVGVYCGSSDTISDDYKQAARQLGEQIAAGGLRLVYGGGSTGMMGAVANGTLSSGGVVVGVTPEIFDNPMLAHDHLTEYIVVKDMHSRKAMMAEMADGFIALPGGFGTLEEFFEMLTWAQVGLHNKPLGLLNVNGYYDPLISFLNGVRDEGFTYPEHDQLYFCKTDPAELLAAMQTYRPPDELARWLER